MEEPNPLETASNKGFSALIALKLRQDAAALLADPGRIYAYPGTLR